MEVDSFYENAKKRAFRLLAVRARSEKELLTKLLEKGYDAAVVRDVIARLRDLKYLDDESFAREWARNLAVNRLFGNRRIETSLREKGLPRELIEQVITEVRQELSEKKALMALVRKKENKISVKMGKKEKNRLAQSLIGKGFSPDLVFDILRSKEEFVNDGE
ncbi:MAG: regulatory protein RecX [Syntrophaceae bacterium]|nr:regulatory protein RecX [Syntrophaceae bacterium]